MQFHHKIIQINKIKNNVLTPTSISWCKSSKETVLPDVAVIKVGNSTLTSAAREKYRKGRADIRTNTQGGGPETNTICSNKRDAHIFSI